MHVAFASFTFASAAPVTAVAAAAVFAPEVAAGAREAVCETCREAIRIVPRRQHASRSPMTAAAHDTTKNEARHVA